MPNPARAGALIYALDLNRLSVFYQQLMGMRVVHADADHHIIASDDMQLILHAIPPHIATTIQLTSPPEPREDQSIKLFFTVPNLHESEKLAKQFGGALFGTEYSGPGFKVRNGYDPEGNIFHLRESAA